MKKIKTAICGYGNLGKGIERSLFKFPDMECVGIFSRRKELKSDLGLSVYSFDDILSFKDKTDVLLLSVGSYEDAPKMSPFLAEHFNIVDSFDDHKSMAEHLSNVDKMALKGCKTAIVAGGWDPGLFSLFRLLGNAFIPLGEDVTFWGRGVSQGHSQAVKKIPRVINAKEYTIPNIELMEKVRKGEIKTLNKEKLHKRECFVAVEKGADKSVIAKQIRNIPNYFKGYDTEVHFIECEEMEKEHTSLSHEGHVFRVGEKERSELGLNISSNPDFTGTVLLSLARAVYVMKNKGEFGAKTIFDIRPKWLIMEEAKLLDFL